MWTSETSPSTHSDEQRQEEGRAADPWRGEKWHARPRDGIVVQVSNSRMPKTGGLRVERCRPAPPPIGTAGTPLANSRPEKGASREGRFPIRRCSDPPSENPRTPRVLVTLPLAHGEYQRRAVLPACPQRNPAPVLLRLGGPRLRCMVRQDWLVQATLPRHMMEG
jgi:hypothetical protein